MHCCAPRIHPRMHSNALHSNIYIARLHPRCWTSTCREPRLTKREHTSNVYRHMAHEGACVCVCVRVCAECRGTHQRLANVAACATVAVSELGWDVHFPLIALHHELHGFGPSFDDLVGCERGRGATRVPTCTACHRRRWAQTTHSQGVFRLGWRCWPAVNLSLRMKVHL